MKEAFVIIAVLILLCVVIGGKREKPDEISGMQKKVMTEVCIGNKATYVYAGNERSCFNGVRLK